MRVGVVALFSRTIGGAFAWALLALLYAQILKKPFLLLNCLVPLAWRCHVSMSDDLEKAWGKVSRLRLLPESSRLHIETLVSELCVGSVQTMF